MSEKRAEELFNKYKKQMISKLGTKALYNDQLNTVGRHIFKNEWIGVFPQNKIQFKNGFQIINVDTDEKKGSHWVGIYQTDKTCYVYDSFGRPTEELLKILTKKIKNKQWKCRDSDRDPEQFGDSEICGQLCLSWLCCVKQLGVKTACKI